MTKDKALDFATCVVAYYVADVLYDSYKSMKQRRKARKEAIEAIAEEA